MLIFIKPSLVSTIPWNPTLFIGPPLPPIFPASPLLDGRLPQGVVSLCIGLCITGLLCTLIPGLTARRLKLVGSKSSSLRRLLLTFRVISAAVGPAPGWGVAAREDEEWRSEFEAVVGRGRTTDEGGVDKQGESKDISSLMPEEEPRAWKFGGGVRLLSSLNVSQNSFPLELRSACCLKLPESSADVSAIISSSGMPSNESCAVAPIIGDECVVVVADIEGCRAGSKSMSLSLVRRTTSASRRNSVSIGALSSASAARIRAKPLVFGSMLPLLVTARRMTPLCPSLPGVIGSPSTFSNVDFKLPSSLSFPDMCSWFAAQLMLSLLERIPSDAISLLK